MGESDTVQSLTWRDARVDNARGPAGTSVAVRRTTAFEWLFVVFGGLPLYLPVILFMGEDGLSSRHPIYWYFWVNAAISSPHVWSTYTRLARKINERRVSRWIGLPLYGAIFGVLTLATKTGHFVEAMTAVNLWQSLHYCRQMYGVSRLLSSDTQEKELTRQLYYWAFHLALPLFVLGRWSVLYTVWGGKSYGMIIPVHVASWIMGLCWGLAVAGMAAGIAAEVFSRRGMKTEYKPARIVTCGLYFAIHIFGFLSPTFFQRGFFAVTLFHAVQYLGIVWFFEAKAPTSRPAALLRRVPATVAFALFVVALFAIGYSMENYVFVAANRLWPLAATVGLSAISAHHYAVDTVIWRRKAGA